MKEFREKIEKIPGAMVLLPTPGTSGRRKTIVRIPLHRLEALFEEEINKASNAAQISLLEEILELPDTNGGCPDSHVRAKFTSLFEDRLKQLQKDKSGVVRDFKVDVDTRL